ncbi:hypothetical protein BVY04_05090, partial [bacterium M21]
MKDVMCPECDLAFQASNEDIGRKARCPVCEAKFIIALDKADATVLAPGRSFSTEEHEQNTGGVSERRIIKWLVVAVLLIVIVAVAGLSMALKSSTPGTAPPP